MFFRDKVIYLGMIDIVKIGDLIKQKSMLTTFIRKSFYSERGIFFPSETCFSNSSYNTLQLSLVIGL